MGEEGAEEEEAVRKERRKRRQLEQNGIHWISMLGGQDLDSGRLFVFGEKHIDNGSRPGNVGYCDLLLNAEDARILLGLRHPLEGPQLKPSAFQFMVENVRKHLRK